MEMKSINKEYCIDDAIILLNSIKNKKKKLKNCNVLYSVNENEEVETIHFNFSVNIDKNIKK